MTLTEANILLWQTQHHCIDIQHHLTFGQRERAIELLVKNLDATRMILDQVQTESLTKVSP